jgi:hypothetical protein
MAKKRTRSSSWPVRDEPDGLRHLPNIGLNLQAQLKAAGIVDGTSLRMVGAAEAFNRIRKREPGILDNALLRLHGAILGVHWRTIDEATQRQLFEHAGINTYTEPGRSGADTIGRLG